MEDIKIRRSKKIDLVQKDSGMVKTDYIQIITSKFNIFSIFALIIVLIISCTIGFYSGFRSGKNSVENRLTKITPDSTAKEAYDLSFTKARVWSADAELQRITSKVSEVNKEGKATCWGLTFYSKNKDKSYEIYVKDGEIRSAEEDKPIIKDMLKGEWKNSAEVYKSVESVVGEKKDFKIESMDLSFDSNAKKWLWTISYNKGGMTVNAEK